MRLYEQSLKIQEGLGDQKGKSATLHEMAYIYRVRGDLDGAMRLYEQSLKIQEGLGDQQGKAMTLGMMGQAFWANARYVEAIGHLLSGLSTLIQLKIEPGTQQAMAQTFTTWRQELSPARFDPLWEKVAGGPLPEWLAAPPEQEEQGMSMEQWVAATVQAARTKDPRCAELYELARKVAADAQYPAEIRALAQVLQRIAVGDFQPDLSSLADETAGMVKAALDK